MQSEGITGLLFWLHCVPLQLSKQKDGVLINDVPCKFSSHSYVISMTASVNIVDWLSGFIEPILRHMEMISHVEFYPI